MLQTLKRDDFWTVIFPLNKAYSYVYTKQPVISPTGLTFFPAELPRAQTSSHKQHYTNREHANNLDAHVTRDLQLCIWTALHNQISLSGNCWCPEVPHLQPTSDQPIEIGKLCLQLQTRMVFCLVFRVWLCQKKKQTLFRYKSLKGRFHGTFRTTSRSATAGPLMMNTWSYGNFRSNSGASYLQMMSNSLAVFCQTDHWSSLRKTQLGQTLYSSFTVSTTHTFWTQNHIGSCCMVPYKFKGTAMPIYDIYGTDHNASMLRILVLTIMQQTSYYIHAWATHHNIGTHPRACGPQAWCHIWHIALALMQ